MEPPELEKNIGIRIYGTETAGIGGHVRTVPEDFLVQEVLTSGEIADIDPAIPEAVGGTGDFLLCTLAKKGYDTFSALRKLSRALQVSSKKISAGGLKDANALTAQYVTVMGVEASHLACVNVVGMKIAPTRFVDAPISAKSLRGNRFNIKIRDIQLDHKKLNNTIGDFVGEINALGGVPNFYGHQRFGTIRPITHIVGRHIVKREFEQAVVRYLTEPSLFESPASRNAKDDFLNERNAKKSLALYPRNLTYERLMLQHLAKNEGDYLGALKKLPLRLARLFVNAFQSFLFNEFLSERSLGRLPLNEACEGDYYVDLDPSGLPLGKAKKVELGNIASANQDINKGRSALALPVVGYAGELSGGNEGEIEQKILEREGVTPRTFYVGPFHEASSSAKYRTALVRIENLDARMERNKGTPEGSSVTLRFFLPKESYATIVLRELMKPTDIIKAKF